MNDSIKGLLKCFLISLFLLCFFYSKILINPNAYLFTAGGDGLKTYYNFASHVKNDTSYLQLNQMSYPYGETLLMEDSLPFFSTTLKVVASVFPFVTNYLVGILNLMLLFSIAIAALFVYKLFIHFKLPPLISAICANAVCFLSAQILLLNPLGHLGLSFICFFPIGWYLLIKFFTSNKKIKWSLVIALNILIWTYVHVYLGFIILVFTFFTYFFKSLYNLKKAFKSPINYVCLFIQIGLPIVIILALSKLGNTHNDRIDMPFLTTNTSSWLSVFVPLISPLKPVYQFILHTNYTPQQFWCEVGNYVGIVCNLFIIVGAYVLALSFIKKSKIKITNYFPSNTLAYILSAVVLLLFSMAIPLKYLPENLINKLPLIKQFSNLGRFAWAFYYVMAVFSFVFFYNLMFHKKVGKIIFYGLIFLCFFEGFAYHTKLSTELIKATNSFNKDYLSANQKCLANMNSQNFQALLPIPYYFRFNIPFQKNSEGADNSICSSMIASYHSALPIMSTYLSRPSVSESMAIFKQLMPYPYQKMIPQLIANGKDIAVLLKQDYINFLNDNEKEIIEKCILLFKNNEYLIYNLSINNLLQTNTNEQKIKFDSIKKQLVLFKNYLVSDSTTFFIDNNFNTLTSPVTYHGQGAYYGIKENYNTICSTNTAKMDTAITYNLSFYYYNKIWDQTFNTLVINEKDSLGNDLQYEYFSPLNVNLIDDWWYFYQHNFKIKSTKSTLTIFFKGEPKFKNWMAVDELLIKPVNYTMWQIKTHAKQQSVYRNNCKYLN